MGHIPTKLHQFHQFLLQNFSYRADTSRGDKSRIGVTSPTVTGVVLTGGRRVADKYRRRQSRPGSQSRRCLIVQSLTVSTAAVSPRSLLYLTDATFHVAAYAAAFLFTVFVAAVSPFGFSWPYKQ